MSNLPFADLNCTQSRGQLLEQHRLLTVEIARLHRVHGDTLAVEKEAKINSFEQSEGTDKRREHVGAFVALAQTKESFKEWAALNALEAERDHVRLLLAHFGLN